MKNKMLAGTFWMSFGSIFSRVLGVLYIIPWLLMLGSVQNQYSAQALYNTAYTPYGLFLVLGTSGIPTAISRKIAIYNAQNRFLDSKKLFQSALLFMAISGLICGGLFFILAPLIAAASPIVNKSAATTVIRSLVPALLILPLMSVTRGWFQGNQDMKPFGLSQLLEQFIRVIFILLATFTSYTLLRQSLTTAIALSTFAAFIGALASLSYLYYYLRSQSGIYRQLSAESLPAKPAKNLRLFKNIFKEALPFVFVGSGITLGQLIDQFTFMQIMAQSTHWTQTQIQNLFTLFSANPNKITTVIISLALAIAETTLPILAGAQHNQKKVSQIIEDNFKLLFGLLTPTVITLSALAGPINTIFFGYNIRGSHLMSFAIMISFILAIFTDILTSLQAVGKHRIAVLLLVIGLLIKILIQYPLINLFYDYGALLATAIAFGVPAVLAVHFLLQECSVTRNFANLTTLVKINAIYIVVIIILQWLSSLISLSNTRITQFVFCSIFTLIAGVIYWWLLSFSGLSVQFLHLKKRYQPKHLKNRS
ncbi:putative polysaccharide biosynthesis protein [Loigolactobacillus binensis]|uniref:Oligosaccharide flippase family protein n=1 Tax=Loigolactobacillus binensis TaxID=2559922 RepID=A0ABW3ECL8_9LACO|nr:polysaccharide biosynthesis protein [Loigolactobacillus binensis]